MVGKVTIDPRSRKVLLQISELRRLTNSAIRRGWFYGGKALVATAKREIDKKPKHGRTYRIARGGRVINHIASAPGESPASITGALKRGINFEVQGHDEMEFGVKDEVKYAPFLELGTPKMKPRPYLKKSVVRNVCNMQRYFEEEIVKTLNRPAEGGVI